MLLGVELLRQEQPFAWQCHAADHQGCWCFAVSLAEGNCHAAAPGHYSAACCSGLAGACTSCMLHCHGCSPPEPCCVPLLCSRSWPVTHAAVHRQGFISVPAAGRVPGVPRWGSPCGHRAHCRPLHPWPVCGHCWHHLRKGFPGSDEAPWLCWAASFPWQFAGTQVGTDLQMPVSLCNSPCCCQ